MTFGLTTTTISCTWRKQNHPTWQQRTQHLNSMLVIMLEWHEDLAFWKSDHWRTNGLRTWLKWLILTITSCHWCTRWRMWKAIAHRNVMIGNYWLANANHNQHRPSLDPRVVRNPLHWERQQDHIDPLRAPRRSRRKNNNNLAQVFKNDRDALYTSQTYKRRDIRECRDRMTLICPFYSIYQFGMGKVTRLLSVSMNGTSSNHTPSIETLTLYPLSTTDSMESQCLIRASFSL